MTPAPDLADLAGLRVRTPAERAFVAGLRWRFRTPERLKPSAWIEQHIRLPAGREQHHGPVRFDKIPFAREVLDSLTEPGLVDILFSGPTRICKTFLLRMAFCYKIAGDPGPMLLIDSTVPKARGLVRKEFMPLVEANPILRARKPTGKARHDYATQQMLFPGASFTVYGANSEAQVSGDTCEVVLGNEAKDWRPATEDTASTLDLVRHRTESYEDSRRHFISSAPKWEDDEFWQEMEKGDLRRYFVPCPDCGTFQHLRWQDDDGPQLEYRVRWDPAARRDDGAWDLTRVLETARYVCERCSAPWTDEMRLAAICHRDAAWNGTQPAQPGFRSYSITGLYGWRKSNRTGELAVDFLRARQEGFVANRQDWYNNRLGLPYKLDLAVITAKKLAHLEAPPAPDGKPTAYLRGQLPPHVRADLVIIGADVQRDRLPWIARAFTWSGQSYLLDHGEAPGWKDLEQVQRAYRLPGATSYVIVDLNYEERRQEVKERIHANQERGWMAADGVEYSAQRVRFDRENVFEGGRLQVNKEYIRKLVISTFNFKHELEARFTGQVRNWWIYSLDLATRDEDREAFARYKKQILDERRRPRKRMRKGLPRSEYVSSTGENHALDCEVYALALFWMLYSTLLAQQKAEEERKRQTPRSGLELRRGA